MYIMRVIWMELTQLRMILRLLMMSKIRIYYSELIPMIENFIINSFFLMFRIIASESKWLAVCNFDVGFHTPFNHLKRD